MKRNIASLNKTNLVSGKLRDLVPELYLMQDAIEDNDWHPEESVFDHTLSVMGSLEKTFLVLTGPLKRRMKQEIDNNSRKILLKIAAIFHDIAKPETLTKEYPTRCVGHEKIGAEKARNILRHFDLSHAELEIIVEIIRNHMTMHYILEPGNPNFQKEFVAFKNRFLNTIYPELILLVFADTINSGLRKTNPKEFKYRIDFLKKEIAKLSQLP